VGRHSFEVTEKQKEKFVRLFKRLNYRFAEEKTMEKRGKPSIADPTKVHTIEAIDPKTGRVREYIFPVEEKK